MDNRRKISYYLNPEIHRGDRVVCDKLDAYSKSEKSRLLRAATLTGFAFLLQEPRIPYMIAELLDENTTIDEIMQVINSVLPSGLVCTSTTQAMFESMIRQMSTNSDVGNSDNKKQAPQIDIDEEATRRNAKNMFNFHGSK